MKTKLNFIYISLSGNTDSFVKRLKDHMEIWLDYDINILNVKDIIKNNETFKKETNKFVAFLPTYLEGGDGIHTGTKEVLTTPLKDYIRFENNYDKCIGIVGSGNKNFNEQYCLTAKQYSKYFNIPVLANYELRGLDSDIDKISIIIDKIMKNEENK